MLLEVKHLTTDFTTEHGVVKAVRDVSFSVGEGEIVGIVGESGSGKSQTMFSIMGLLAENGQITSGDILFDGEQISPLCFPGTPKEFEKQLRKIRGNKLSMIFQDPLTFLNPVLSIETQLTEHIVLHQKVSHKEAKKKALELMRIVGIPSPEERIKQYPHQFSGGMRQRIIIAIALACGPKLIVADEPTTALDVTIQAQVLELIRQLRDSTRTSIILITHDLGVVANMCDRIIIMYGGKIVEQGTDMEIFYQPKHEYTKGLLASVNDPDRDDKAPLQPIPGSPPDLLNPPKGCPFVDRCPEAMEICLTHMPESVQLSPTHSCACWMLHAYANQKDATGAEHE